MSDITCRVCKKKVNKEIAICLKPKFYVCSEECKEVYSNTQQINKKADDRKEFLRYFDLVCSEKINYAIIGSILKKIMKDNPSFTYKGMQYTLYYISNILNIQITSVGIIPYYYDEAKRYYDKKQKMKQAIKQSNIRQDTKTICRRIKRIEDEDIFD